MSMGDQILMTVSRETDEDEDEIINNSAITDTKITINKDTTIKGDLTVEKTLNVNDLGELKDTNSVGLISHHHMKNYATMEHHHIHGSGFKMKVNDETYVVTSAHNIYEVQHRPTEFGVEHIMDLPYQQGGVVAKNNNLNFGDGDTLVIENREILCCSSSIGTFFWDVTRADFAYSHLIDFKPKQNRDDVRLHSDDFNAPKGVQVWNQVKANKNTKYVYEQMGEVLDIRTFGYPQDNLSDVSINIYDLSNAHNNEIKLVNKFQDKWSLNNSGHYKILFDMYNDIYAKNTNEDQTAVYPTFQNWAENVVGQNVIPSNHNLQISSEANLMFICGVTHFRGTPVPFTNGSSRFRLGGVLVYDIDPNRMNPQTNQPCSESPYFLSIAGGSSTLKVLTENEKTLLYNGELFDENKMMKLDIPMNDANRPTIITTSYGYLPESLTGTNSSGNLYVHDCWSIRTTIDSNEKDLLYISKGSNGGWPYPDTPIDVSNPANFFGHTFGDFMIFDLTDIRNESKLPVYHFPMHPDNPIDGILPGGGYPHNLTPRTDNSYVYCGYELPDGPGNASLEHTMQSKIYVFDTSNIENITYVTNVSNLSTIKQVKNGVGQIDANHNFDVISYKGKDYLAFADYIDGFHVFDITGDNGKNPVQISWASPKERLSNNNPWYSNDDLQTTYVFQADVMSNEWSNCWGVKFGKMGKIFAMTREVPCVYSFFNSGDQDIRTYENMNKKYTKYPELAIPNYIKCVDNNSNEVALLDLIAMDRYTDIAVLKPKDCCVDKVKGGIDVADNVKLGEQVICAIGNGSHGESIVKGMVSGVDKCLSPHLIQKVSRVDSTTKLSDGHVGLLEQVHDNIMLQDIGRSANTAAIHSASVCSIGLPTIVASVNVPKGASGSPLLNVKGELLGMVNYRKPNGSSMCFANDGKLIAELVTKMVNNTFVLPYIGVKLLQDILVTPGYMIVSVDPDSNVYDNIILANETYDELTELNEGETLAWSLVAVNGTSVGPNRTPVTKLLLSSNVSDTVTITVKPYKSYESMGSTKYEQLDLENASFDVDLNKRPNVLNKFEELPDSENPNPSFTWFWEEKLGFYI